MVIPYPQFFVSFSSASLSVPIQESLCTSKSTMLEGIKGPRTEGETHWTQLVATESNHHGLCPWIENVSTDFGELIYSGNILWLLLTWTTQLLSMAYMSKFQAEKNRRYNWRTSYCPRCQRGWVNLLQSLWDLCLALTQGRCKLWC